MNLDFKKLKPHPLFASLPEDLKSKEKFEEVETVVRSITAADHKHKTVKSYVKCKRCQEKLVERRKALLGFGFTSTEQYLMWKRVMDIWINEKDIRIA